MNKICTVSIISHNSGNVLPRCLDSIKKFIPLTYFDIVVIDNNSTDGIENWIQHYPFVQFERLPQNCGFSKAHNYAFQKSKNEFFLALNPDIEFLDQDIMQLFEQFKKDSKIGILSPKMLVPNTQYPSFLYRDPNILSLALRRAPQPIANFGPIKYLLKRYNYFDRDHKKSMEVDWCSGAFMLLRKNIIKGENLFDENYFLYFEDSDVCKRIRKKGYKIFYYPDFSYIHHWERRTLSENNLKKYLIESMFIYFKKWGWKFF